MAKRRPGYSWTRLSEGAARTRIRAERFADPHDQQLFPRLSDAKIARLAERGVRRAFAPGEVLFEQGTREIPFFVVEEGRVEFVDHTPRADVVFAELHSRCFIGDLAVFTGEPSVAECVAVEPTRVIAFTRQELRAMLADWPEFAELVLRTLSLRRAWVEGEGHGVLRLIASRSSRRAFEVRDLLERNLLPVRFYDVDSDEDSAALLEGLCIPREETPILIRGDQVLRNPSVRQVARDLGLRAEVDGERFDLVTIGGGPAGLAAAVYGASEGLRTFVAESWAPGGQASTSTRIENYLGFPTGISGTELTRNATLQAQRFDAVLSSFHPVVEITDGPEGLVRVDLEDGQHVLARTVVVASGARWRTLEVPGIDRLWGAGVYHAAMPSDARRLRGEDVVLVGGGNSAGQAAVKLASTARSVRMAVRGPSLARTMSRYLIDRIEAAPNIEVRTHTEVVGVHGATHLEAVDLRDGDGNVERLPAAALFVMIGADPCTEAVDGVLALDEAGYIKCGKVAAKHEGHDCWPLSDRPPHLLETVRPGVFAAGDVRSGATNRVAGAVGDGAMAVRFAHQVLDA